jgi:nicotinamidase-related amidase
MVDASRKEVSDLHGNVPDRSTTVLLLVDVINDLEFPDNRYLVQQCGVLADRISKLKQRCRSLSIPTVYVNDNRGRWRSDVREVIKQCRRKGAAGQKLVSLLLPQNDDYVVLKPKHSAFFATPLELILQYLGASTIIVAGITTNACVLISAGEIFLREYRLVVPSDCVAALTEVAQTQALTLMKDNFDALTTPSTELDLAFLVKNTLKKQSSKSRQPAISILSQQ